MQIPDKWDNTCNVLLARQFDDAVKLDTDNKQQMEKFYIWRKRMTAMAMGANVQMLFDMTLNDMRDLQNAVDATPRITDEDKAKAKAYWSAADEAMYSILVKVVSGKQLESVVLEETGFANAWRRLCEKNELKDLSTG